MSKVYIVHTSMQFGIREILVILFKGGYLADIIVVDMLVAFRGVMP